MSKELNIDQPVFVKGQRGRIVHQLGMETTDENEPTWYEVEFDNGGSDHFTETEITKDFGFELGTFDSDAKPVDVIEGGLHFKIAVNRAKALWESGKHYGVAVIDQDPNSIEPIQWIMSKSEVIENIPLSEDEQN